MPPATLYTGKQNTIRLGHQLGRGGEGAVYQVQGNPDLVAKLYHQPDPKTGQKIGLMARTLSEELLRVSAWPMDTLHPAPGGAFLGLLMPCVREGREIYCLYSPMQRRQEFPHADWTFLILAARNLADAFATVHAHHCVVGDVNQGNVFVSPKAEVRLIDCDSYQILAPGFQFLCEVGVGHFTPPELQGKHFAGLVRTPNHDAFGLAILIFHLLFMGRHPFAGRYHGRGDMPIEEAIKGFRFAFSRQAQARQMSPPPLALALTAVAQPLASLFERAFAPEGAKDRGRPAPTEWVATLDQFRSQLKACPRYPGHKYFTGLPQCPWCELEQQGATDFFITLAGAATAAAGSVFNAAAVWKHIALHATVALPALPTPPPQRSYTPTPLSTAVKIWKVATPTLIAGLVFTALWGIGAKSAPPGTFFVSVILWIILAALSPYRRERERRRTAAADLESEQRAAQTQWTQTLGPLVEAMRAKYSALERAKRALDGLPAYHLAQKQKLHDARERDQLQHHLERFYLKDAGIPGIGPTRIATLASYGIETAADISGTRLDPVPGFGPARTGDLLRWRGKMATGFRFDPRKGIDPADLATLQKRIDGKRRELESTLAMGAKDLAQSKTRLDGQAKTLGQEYLRVHDRLSQAQATARLVA